MIACLCPAIVRLYCWLICDVAVTYVRDGQTEPARPRARAYKYPVVGSIQHMRPSFGGSPVPSEAQHLQLEGHPAAPPLQHTRASRYPSLLLKVGIGSIFTARSHVLESFRVIPCQDSPRGAYGLSQQRLGFLGPFGPPAPAARL